MSHSLFCKNTPQEFWQCIPNPPEEDWNAAIESALPVPGIDEENITILLEKVLGERRFGPEHWKLGFFKKLYYKLKPFLPRPLINILKKYNSRVVINDFPLGWPIEEGYARFLWEVLRHLLIQAGRESITITRLWPGDYRYCLVLTHDIEEQAGQAFASQVADLEQSLGLRSSFNFVPERYSLDPNLMNSLRTRGFEIGVHGLKHDGKLFSSQKLFQRRAVQISRYLQTWQAVGFRSPLTHRNPEWMQALEMEYDLSFFDTDPYEPMPGGSMSIWPYWIGRFVELPYTLVQDSTLAFSLGETTPEIWLDKLAFLSRYQGIALLNTHPDYLRDPVLFGMYQSFLEEVIRQGGFWNPLPRTAARWWRCRTQAQTFPDVPPVTTGSASIINNLVMVE